MRLTIVGLLAVCVLAAGCTTASIQRTRTSADGGSSQTRASVTSLSMEGADYVGTFLGQAIDAAGGLTGMLTGGGLAGILAWGATAAKRTWIDQPRQEKARSDEYEAGRADKLAAHALGRGVDVAGADAGGKVV